MSASVVNFSMSLDGYIAVRTTNPPTPAATASTGCTSGTSLRTGSFSGRPGRPDN